MVHVWKIAACSRVEIRYEPRYTLYLRAMAEVIIGGEQDSSIRKTEEIKPVLPVERVSSSESTKIASSQETEKRLEGSNQRSLDYITGTQSLLTVVILVLACIVAFSSRLFAVIRFESVIHEFDPWYVMNFIGGVKCLFVSCFVMAFLM